MVAPDELLYEYAVIRFVPRVDREEFVNIGLIMMNKRNKWLKSMVMLDEKRIKTLFPNSDIDCLKVQSKLFEMNDVPSGDLPVEEKYRWLTAVKNACLQVSPSHPGILIKENDNISKSTQDLMNEEFNRLFFMLVL